MASHSRTALDGQADGWSVSAARTRAPNGGLQAERGAQTDSPVRFTQSAQCEGAAAREWDAHESSATNGNGPGPGSGLKMDTGSDAWALNGPGGRPRPGMPEQLNLSRSQIWVELAEARLNQSIGNCNMLLASLSTSDDVPIFESIEIDETRVTTNIEVANHKTETSHPFPKATAEAPDASLFGSSSALVDSDSESPGAERRDRREFTSKSMHAVASQKAAGKGVHLSPSKGPGLITKAPASGGSGALFEANLNRTQMPLSTHILNAAHDDLDTCEFSKWSRCPEVTHDVRQVKPFKYKYSILA